MRGRGKDIRRGRDLFKQINCMQYGGDIQSVLGRLESLTCTERRRSSVESDSRPETKRRSNGKCDEIFISKALKERIIGKSNKKAMKRIIVLEEADRLLTGGGEASSVSVFFLSFSVAFHSGSLPCPALMNDLCMLYIELCRTCFEN